MPRATDWAAPAEMNSSVATNTPGTPRSSKSEMSCTLHDVQLPQSANASMTKLHCVAISCRKSTGAGFVNVGLEKRSTLAPRSVSNSSMRFKKTLPRGFEMSSNPTVRPFTLAGRASNCRTAGVYSLVGSRMVMPVAMGISMSRADDTSDGV